ncbi:ComF family protein [Pajaroellobacter abortibovis]|uniref:ComF family protein n=1 Tax=Pajaroellobacter abortibovis TaxID=1882918 RepID=UPI0012EC82DA|nr:hypothetical protein [Pajaroellobacter abortibovis]
MKPIVQQDAHYGAPFVCEGVLALAIYSMKCGWRSDLISLLARLMMREVTEVHRCADLIVPVPSDPVRLVTRGFNPATLLARSVGQALSLKIASYVLVRLHPTLDQVSLNRKGRSMNMIDGFTLQ